MRADIGALAAFLERADDDKHDAQVNALVDLFSTKPASAAGAVAALRHIAGMTRAEPFNDDGLFGAWDREVSGPTAGFLANVLAAIDAEL